MAKVLLLLGAILPAVLLAGGAGDLERRFEQSFPGPSEAVILDVVRGVVEVSNGPADSEVAFEIVVRLQGSDRAENERRLNFAPDLLAAFKRDAERALEGLAPRYRADARRVEMHLRDSRPVVVDSDPSLQAVINVRVRVPEGRRLEIRTVAAGVTIEQHSGPVDIRNETGSSFLGTIAGDLSVRATGGSITVQDARGRADLRTATGNIFVGHLRGPSRLRTSNGSVEVLQAHDSISVEGDDCDILLSLSAPVPPDIALRTSAGTITLNIDRNLPLTVDATTRLLGKVRARGIEPVVRSGGFNASSLLADLNGGGERVNLRTKWGNIVLVGRDPLDG
jgi:hypothetical protein